MESIYYVLSWLCHRTCPHCYDDRFRPYYGEDLKRVIAEAEANYARVIENFPDRMTFLDPREDMAEKRGRIILAGGEILLDGVRESVLYPALELLHEKYARVGGVELIVQTTGDVLRPRILEELLSRHVFLISVSGVDAFHAGLEAEPTRKALTEKLSRMFESAGVRPFPPGERTREVQEGGPWYHFFGATPDSWIGKIWPRGRAHQNELSTATLADNFCNGWSGGLNFLDFRHAGSEVSVEPNGNVYPCCMKTRIPVGNLIEEKLEAILTRLAGDPVYEAISIGHPERMGITYGWDVGAFFEKSRTMLASGREYQNLCVGCDRFHDEVLAFRRRQELVTISGEGRA